jgi:flagellar biosynthesis/type III secretory pathway M-ring protein FliF/YscJ
MDGFTPVIVIEGFLGLGVVLLLYWLHMREMKKIRAEKKEKARKQAELEARQAHDNETQADTEGLKTK